MHFDALKRGLSIAQPKKKKHYLSKLGQIQYTKVDNGPDDPHMALVLGLCYDTAITFAYGVTSFLMLIINCFKRIFCLF